MEVCLNWSVDFSLEFRRYRSIGVSNVADIRAKSKKKSQFEELALSS